MNEMNVLTNTEESTAVKNEDYGTISFADEVLTKIAGLATVNIEGVAGMSGKLVEGITEFLGKKNFSKGIKVVAGKEDIVVDMNIVVNYGISIPDVCHRIQKSVVSAIESMAGLHVAAVNIAVQGLVINETPAIESTEKPEETDKIKN